MFVRKRRFDELMEFAARLLDAKMRLHQHIDKLHAEISYLKQTRVTPRSSEFSDEEIRALIRLCHPDRHNGSEAATRMTGRLLQLRRR